MELVEWSESLSVGDKEIDEQHKKMLGIINKLHHALVKGESNRVLNDTLQDLLAYTQEHFVHEEAYFEKLEYPEAEEHKKEHQDFIKKVSQFYYDFDRGKLSLSLEVMNFLVEWFLRHIQHTDQKYAKIAKSE